MASSGGVIRRSLIGGVGVGLLEENIEFTIRDDLLALYLLGGISWVLFPICMRRLRCLLL